MWKDKGKAFGLRAAPFVRPVKQAGLGPLWPDPTWVSFSLAHTLTTAPPASTRALVPQLAPSANPAILEEGRAEARRRTERDPGEVGGGGLFRGASEGKRLGDLASFRRQLLLQCFFARFRSGRLCLQETLRVPAESSRPDPFPDSIPGIRVSFAHLREVCGPAMASAPALPPFQFRARHESPDWRRLSAVDAGRVAAELDVAALQEHLEHVTFCSAERERCPHCQAPADPLLLRLFRLAQLCLEYLLHSQDYLSGQLRALHAHLRDADAHRARLADDLAAKEQLLRALKDECKRRRRMIGTQQMMLQTAAAACHQCQFCEKSFMNYSFLHNHLQRRHAEESLSADQKKKEQTDKLQEEIDKLKDQLQLTRSQLEAEQHTHMVKLAKEYEEHRSKEEEIRHLFHKWKEEEKEKLATELEKVKEMFMKEFKELTTKNTELENHLVELQKSNKHLKSNLGTLKDSFEFPEEKPRNVAEDQSVIQLLEKQESKWASKVQTLQEEHENEKHQLLSQIEKLKTTMTEDLNTSNAFYKKRIEELGQRLQEQNDLIIAQKHQIQKLATRSVESIKLSDTKASGQNVAPPKSSLSSVPEQALLVHMLEPIEELPEDEKETEKSETRVGKNKHHIISTLKNNPSLTKELRAVLEQTLTEKLESLGIKSGVRGIPSDHLTRVLMSVESAREERKKEVPDIQHIREQLERQMNVRVAEKASCIRHFSSPLLSSEVRQKAHRIGGSLSTVLPKPAKRSFVKRPTGRRTMAVEKTSTPKTKESVLGDNVPRKSLSITTPPFSSEDEVDDNDIMQSYISPELSQPRPSVSGSKNALARAASQSDGNSLEEDEVEEIKGNLKPSQGVPIQKGTEQVEKTSLCQRKESQSSGGINVALSFVQKNAQGVKFTGVMEEDEDDWDLSSLEEETSLPAKDAKVRNGAATKKDDTNTTSAVQPVGKLTKTERLQDADSTLKSSLVTVTDWSDSSDI
ncbi:cilium assembly protein DZIP1 [Heteronotia binoei]|uniref:cilium assembly protein DZIP1 n=1 Tax=Heteronotia binoei TaxID=13085 RepID=UPI00292EDCA4|nr:cilium assembly protein DZIP1 [Heteronotia binoei]